MTQQYFSWDEISAEIQIEEDREDLRKRSDEIGMVFRELMPNGVAVFATDRHIGLECWAEDVNEADAKFTEHPVYAEFYREPE
jgi:predicted glycosyl hydrolase (DUF1957 family)